MRKITVVAAACGVLAAAPLQTWAEASDPAAQQVDAFDRALLATMKQGKAAGAQARFRRIEPVVAEDFNLSAMIRQAVGAGWSKMSGADQAALLAAFTRFTAANYAHNFDSYGGQKFMTGAVTTRLPDKLVQTQIVNPTGAPITLAYRMRAVGGRWKIVDVFYNGGISSLAAQSSDFKSTLDSGGGPALVKKLNDQSQKLLQGD